MLYQDLRAIGAKLTAIWNFNHLRLGVALLRSFIPARQLRSAATWQLLRDSYNRQIYYYYILITGLIDNQCTKDQSRTTRSTEQLCAYVSKFRLGFRLFLLFSFDFHSA